MVFMFVVREPTWYLTMLYSHCVSSGQNTLCFSTVSLFSFHEMVPISLHFNAVYSVSEQTFSFVPLHMKICAQHCAFWQLFSDWLKMGECYKYQTFACSLFYYLWINKVTLYAIMVLHFLGGLFRCWLFICYAQDMLDTVDRSMKCLKLGMSYLGEIYRFFSPNFVPGSL
jgi:flagellar biosynthesis protein FliQ